MTITLLAFNNMDIFEARGKISVNIFFERKSRPKIFLKICVLELKQQQ